MNRINYRSTLRALGGWQLDIDGAPAAGPGYRKGRGLLAYLALEDGWHARETLGDLFDVRSAGHLRQILSNLRGTLHLPDGPPGLLVEHNLIRLNPDYPLWQDAARFLAPLPKPRAGDDWVATVAALDARLSLYGGEFLLGLSLPDCADFEAWVETRRVQCHQQALGLLTQLHALNESHGQVEAALGYARRMAELDPWNEAAQRHVIRLLALGGNAAAALAQYEACCRMLDKELGLAPDAETAALAASIRSGDLKARPAVSAASAAPAATLAPATAPVTTERRVVTVLCCDLQLPGVDDIELIAETLAPLRQRCQQRIADAGGHLVPSQGGRLLAYFGFPQARENAARHAVRTALALARKGSAAVQVRLGIHSGPVIVDARTGEPDIAGIASGWAIVLAEAAAAGQPCISEPARLLVQGYFHLQPQGVLADRQGHGHQPIFCVLDETGAATRLQTRSSLSPLVGRETELAELLALWQESREGRHPSLLVRGDAGIGKSRLVHSLVERIGGEAHVLLELRCFPEFSQTPFYPLLGLLSESFGFARQDSDAQRQEKIAAFLRNFLALRPDGLGMGMDDALSLLAEVLHLPLPPNDTLPAQRRKELTGDLLLGLIEGLAQNLPLLLVVEDLHWCDPSTLDLLSRHVRRKFGAPVLTLITTRAGLDWQAADATLDLPPLSDADTGRLVQHVIAEMGSDLGADLSPDDRARIVAWSDGIPLFAEEMARLARPRDGAGLTLDAPFSLQELLASRLDAVGAAKSTAQLAAALGREFDVALLKQVSPLPAEAVEQHLRLLQESGLVLPMAAGHCQFKHALIQDVAYQSLARLPRQAHHRRIADLLMAGSAAEQAAAVPPEVLARHLTQAGDAAAAVPHWLHAGQWAAARSANREAEDHFLQGLRLLDELPPSPGKARLEFSLQVALGILRIALSGYGSDTARGCFDRAVELSRDVADDAASFPAMFGLWQGGSTENVTAAPLDLADRLDRIARASGDPAHRLVTDYAYGNNLFWLARYDEARRHQEAAVNAPASVSSGYLIAHYGEDSRILARSFLAWTLWFQGYADQARQQMAQALADARKSGHAHSLGFALTFASVLYRHIGQPAETARLCKELGELAQRHGLSLWQAAAAAVGGWAHVACGDPAGLPPIHAGVAASRVAMRLVEATFRSFLLDALVRLGYYDEALRCAEETVAIADTLGDAYLLPEIFRLQAGALAAVQPEAGVEVAALLHQALATARRQGARILALRCACDLVELSGPPDGAAVAQLQACLANCPEGADTPDLQRAAALLAFCAESDLPV